VLKSRSYEGARALSIGMPKIFCLTFLSPPTLTALGPAPGMVSLLSETNE
jgi:hypothetical protein